MTLTRTLPQTILALSLVAGMIGGSQSAWATAAYDNLGTGYDTYSKSLSGSGPLGASFSVGTDYSLTNVQIQLSADTTNTNGSFMVFIANQSGSAPDLSDTNALASQIFSDTNSIFTGGGFANLDWTLSSPLSLTSGTYWVVVEDKSTSPDVSSVAWSQTYDS